MKEVFEELNEAELTADEKALLEDLPGLPELNEFGEGRRKFLTGKAATEANFKLAADAEMRGAKPLEHNKFKVELGRRAIVRALSSALNGALA